MCGICGVIHFDGSPPSATSLSRMTESLRHRGPDGDGVHIDGPVGLGHRRLAIIDTSPAGAQPMSTDDGSVCITYNGEIYNFAEIRRALEARGHAFRSRSDTEVILRAYEEWGVECLTHFNGIFAFALWDSRRKHLWLVRDRLGVKPLFYLKRDDRLVFGSEIKAILQDPTVERAINVPALHHYLSLNYVPAPLTLFRDIEQILPGHYLLVDADRRYRDVSYWDVSYQGKRSPDERRLLDEFDEKLSKAVSMQMVSDVPLGAFLSGGVDSSAIVYWMSQSSNRPVQTFSIGFEEASYSELNYARQIAGLCNTQHHERVVSADAIDLLPRIVRHAEEPTADSSMLPLYKLAKMAREKVTVALSGDGADEILAGYETYQAYHLANAYRRVPPFVRSHLIAPLVESLPVSDRKVSLDFKLRRFVKGAELDRDDSHAYWRMIFDESMKASLYRPEVLQELDSESTFDLYRAMFNQTDATDPLDRMLYVDTRFYLPNDMLVKLDRMSMAHSLEARVPFLDHKLVEFIATVPAEFKLKRLRQKKYLLKAALKRRLPDAPVWRKKQGFNVPKGIWLKGSLRDFAFDQLSEKHIGRMGLFRTATVTGLLNEHVTGKRDNSHQIWGLLCLSLWWREFIASSAATT